MLPRLFDPYTQAEAAGTHAAGCLGLGLPLVRAIVEEHGGAIAASSPDPGRGSEFVVRWPAPPHAGGRGRRIGPRLSHAPGARVALTRCRVAGTLAPP
jgi:hypothetical protein